MYPVHLRKETVRTDSDLSTGGRSFSSPSRLQSSVQDVPADPQDASCARFGASPDRDVGRTSHLRRTHRIGVLVIDRRNRFSSYYQSPSRPSERIDMKCELLRPETTSDRTENRFRATRRSDRMGIGIWSFGSVFSLVVVPSIPSNLYNPSC